MRGASGGEVDAATRALLRRLAAKYETAAFADDDPVQFLRGAGDGPNLETTAFVAASLSYGSRKQFIPKIAELIGEAGGDVHGWVESGGFRRRFHDGDRRSFYRLFSCGMMSGFLAALQGILRGNGSLGEFLRANGATTGPRALEALCGAFAGKSAPIVPKDCSSACKRLCLFLRWMARDGSPVDYGPWAGWFDKGSLVIPLDVHVLRQARRLGLVKSNTATMATARSLTARLAEVFPGDPCKGDFALFGFGVDGGGEL